MNDEPIEVTMSIDKEGRVKLWTKDIAEGFQDGRELPPGMYKIKITDVLEVQYHDE